MLLRGIEVRVVICRGKIRDFISDFDVLGRRWYGFKDWGKRNKEEEVIV